MSRVLRAFAGWGLLAWAAAAGSAAAQALTWVPLGPEGGSVTSLVIDPRTPTRVLAGTEGGGALRTVDGATTWSWTAGPYVNVVPQIVAHPTAANTFYAATDLGLMLTTNAGDIWDPVQVGAAGSTTPLVAVAIDPTTPTTLYVASDVGAFGASAAVLKSVNSGATWTTLMLGTTNSNTSALTVDPSAPATVWAGTGCCDGGVYKSVNGGTSWTAMSSGIGSPVVDTILVDPSSSMTVLVAAGDGLYRSVDGGGTFTPVAGGLPMSRLTALTVGPGPVFWAAIGTTIYSSTDHGVSWSAHGPIAGAASILSICVDPTNAARIFIGTDGTGVFESTDTGATWAAKNTGFFATWATALASFPAAAPTSLWLGTTHSGAFHSNNRGASWASVTLPMPVTSFASDSSAPNTIYAIANGVLQKTTDGGAGWDAETTGLPMGAGAVAVSASMPSTVFVGQCLDNVYRSNDGAATFNPAGTEVNGRCVQSLAVSAADVNHVVVSAGGGYDNDAVLFSSNGGTSWADGGGIPGDASPGQLAVDQTNPPRFYLAVNGGVGGGGVFTSTDQGVSWSVCPAAAGEVAGLVVDPVSHTLYVGATGHVFQSTDHCATFTELTADLYNVDINSIALGVAPDLLYVGTFASGVFALRRSDGGTPDGGLGDGGTLSDGGTVMSDGGSTMNDGGTTLPDGGTTPMDGGIIVEPDGGLLLPDGGVLLPDGGTGPGVVQGTCGCTDGAGLVNVAWLLAVALVMRRRRAPRPSTPQVIAVD